MDEKILIFLLLAVSAFGVNLTTFFQEKNCDPKCIFDTQNLTSQTVGLFPTMCSTVCTHLLITKYTDLTEEHLTTTFSNMKRLIGSISVAGTKFKSASFLAGLESIDCGNSSIYLSFNNQMVELGLTNLTSVSCSSFQINSNKNLRRLGISKLRNITIIPSDYNMGVYIESQSKNFCITTEEMENLICNVNLDARFGAYCPPTKAENLCIPPEVCSRVFGDLEISAGSDLSSINSVEIIFGSLIINGTNLTDFNFLENLKYVAQMQKDKSAIIVENNLDLVNISFPKLKRVRSDNLHSVVFTGNNLNMSRDVDSCIRLADDLGLFKSWSPIFDGKDCITMNFTVDWPENSSTKQGELGLLIFFILFYF